MTSRPPGTMSAATPPGTTQSIISRCPNASAARAQHHLAVQAVARERKGEARVVADRATSPRWLAIRSSSAMTARSASARGGASDFERGLGGPCEGDRMGDGGVARETRGEARRHARRLAAHQRQLALMRVAEPRLQPDHRLAVRGEAEMPRLDDSGMDRADRDLMQVLALRRQEFGRLRAARRGHRAERHRVHAAPLPVIQPGPQVARTLRLMAPEVLDHALEPRGPWPVRRKRG